jgi:hypothetical protein
MSSIRELVILEGKLVGEGREASCDVEATKVSLPDGSDCAYSHFSIRNVSRRLPEGTYRLFVAGEEIAVRQKNGFWLSGSAV